MMLDLVPPVILMPVWLALLPALFTTPIDTNQRTLITSITRSLPHAQLSTEYIRVLVLFGNVVTGLIGIRDVPKRVQFVRPMNDRVSYKDTDTDISFCA
jgi:hypothetical protein